MKPIVILFALTGVASALPCTAQSPVVHQRRHGFPLSPELKARLALGGEMERAGAEALRNRDFVAAEGDFRDSIRASSWAPGYYGLGEALAGQGRTVEAIEAYRVGIYGPPYTVAVLNDIPVHGQYNPDVRECAGEAGAQAWMKYALLISQTGVSTEAIVIYKKALAQLPHVDALGLDASLASGTLTPAEFQAGAHMALGICATYGGTDTQAMSEFDKALRLRPDSPLANYYYGYGWQHLALKGQARATLAPQAKAAFQKAASLGEGDVKKNAEEALKAFAPPR